MQQDVTAITKGLHRGLRTGLRVGWKRGGKPVLSKFVRLPFRDEAAELITSLWQRGAGLGEEELLPTRAGVLHTQPASHRERPLAGSGAGCILVYQMLWIAAVYYLSYDVQCTFVRTRLPSCLCQISPRSMCQVSPRSMFRGRLSADGLQTHGFGSDSGHFRQPTLLGVQRP